MVTLKILLEAAFLGLIAYFFLLHAWRGIKKDKIGTRHATYSRTKRPIEFFTFMVLFAMAGVGTLGLSIYRLLLGVGVVPA